MPRGLLHATSTETESGKHCRAVCCLTKTVDQLCATGYCPQRGSCQSAILRTCSRGTRKTHGKQARIRDNLGSWEHRLSRLHIGGCGGWPPTAGGGMVRTLSLLRGGREDDNHAVARKLLHVATVQQQQVNDLATRAVRGWLAIKLVRVPIALAWCTTTGAAVLHATSLPGPTIPPCAVPSPG